MRAANRAVAGGRGVAHVLTSCVGGVPRLLARNNRL